LPVLIFCAVLSPFLGHLIRRYIIYVVDTASLNTLRALSHLKRYVGRQLVVCLSVCLSGRLAGWLAVCLSGWLY